MIGMVFDVNPSTPFCPPPVFSSMYTIAIGTERRVSEPLGRGFGWRLEVGGWMRRPRCQETELGKSQGFFPEIV